MGPPRGHMYYNGLPVYREKHEKILLSETIRPRGSIFVMLHHLVNLYHVCSNYAPWAKICPAPGGHMFYIGLHREKYGKIFLSETIMPRALKFGI